MAAGSWRTGAGLGDANIAVARRTIAAALNASEKNRELLGHPVMQSILAQDDLLGPLLGELGVSFGLLTTGTAKMAATVEGTDVALTNYSLANSTTITPARHAFARAASDFGRALQQPLLTGELAPDAYAMVIHEAMMVWANTLVDKIVALFPSLTNTIGTTNTALSWSAIQDGIIDHKDRGNRGPVLGIIDSVGAKALMSDMLSMGGAVQWAPQAQGAIQNATAGAYLGRFWEADFYMSGELDDDGTDTSGALLSVGCIATKHARVPLPSEAMEIADGYWFTVEGRRTAGSETRFDIVSHLAAQIREDGRGSELLYKMT